MNKELAFPESYPETEELSAYVRNQGFSGNFWIGYNFINEDYYQDQNGARRYKDGKIFNPWGRN